MDGDEAELDKYYRAIGRLSVEFAALETQMHALTWQALGFGNPAGLAVTETMFANDLTRLLNRFLKLIHQPAPGVTASISAELGPELVSELEEVVSSFSVIAADRNKAIHGGFPLGGGLLRVRDAVGQHRRSDPPPRTSLSFVEGVADRSAQFRSRAARLTLSIARYRAGFDDDVEAPNE